MIFFIFSEFLDFKKFIIDKLSELTYVRNLFNAWVGKGLTYEKCFQLLNGSYMLINRRNIFCVLRILDYCS